MSIKIDFLEKEIKYLQEIRNLEIRIENSEKNLVKCKAPLDLVGYNDFFVVDNKGNDCILKLCNICKKNEQYINELHYKLSDFVSFVSILNGSNISKKTIKIINQRIDNNELSISGWNK